MAATTTPQELSIALTPENRAAGVWLLKVREDAGFSQAEMADRLTKQLNLDIKAGRLSSYETGARLVPAAILIAASSLTGIPITASEADLKKLVDRLADAVAERLRGRPGLDGQHRQGATATP